MTDAGQAVRDAIERSIEGWNNVVELGLLPPQHRDTAQHLSDELRAALANLAPEAGGEAIKRKDCPACDMPLSKDGGCYYPYCFDPQKPTTQPPTDAEAMREGMLRTAKELRESPNRDCRQVQEAIMWETKAADLPITKGEGR